MELIIISNKKSTSSQAIALPGSQEIQVPQPVAFVWPEVNAHSCTSSWCPTKGKYAPIIILFVMLCARFYSFACSVCLILLSCWFRGSRAEVVSWQFFVSWLCRAFISSRGSILLNFFAPCFFQCVLWLQSRSYFTAISVPWLCRAFNSSSLFLCFCNSVKCIVMQIKLLLLFSWRSCLLLRI